MEPERILAIQQAPRSAMSRPVRNETVAVFRSGDPRVACLQHAANRRRDISVGPRE
jgi:hypothetical protein